MEKSLNKDLLIIPLTKRYDCSSFCCTNTELNEFLKNDALLDQTLMVSRTYLCCQKKQAAGYFTLVADTLEVEAVGQIDKIEAISVSNDIGCRYITVDSKPESMGFYEKHNFKIVEKYRHNAFPKMYLNMYPIVVAIRPKENLKEFEDR